MNLLELMVAAEHQPHAAVGEARLVRYDDRTIATCAVCALNNVTPLVIGHLTIGSYDAVHLLTWIPTRLRINARCCSLHCKTPDVLLEDYVS